jgi:uncharacterized protein
MERAQKSLIEADLKKKMVFLVGPRQVGKTWLAKEIAKEYKHSLYLSYDSLADRKLMLQEAWLSETDLIIFDELHKMPKWKNYLKGIYDTKSSKLHILVTGSARLETFRKAGDSLAGRFFVHHLLPLSLKEVAGTKYRDNIEHLIERGGFPEPFLSALKTDANRWRQGYIDSLLREDIIEFTDIDRYKAMGEVFEIVRTKVGAPLSYQNIAADVGISPVTVKKYIEILKALYIVYTISPYSKKISRSILKEQKLYFYDTGLVQGDEGAVFENLVANALLKDIYLKRDTKAFLGQLLYLKNKEKKEVDFLLTNTKNEPEKMIEVKVSDKNLSPNLVYFADRYNIKGVQVVKNLSRGERRGNLLEIRSAKDFFSSLEI